MVGAAQTRIAKQQSIQECIEETDKKTAKITQEIDSMEKQISFSDDPKVTCTYMERIDIWLIELTTIETTLKEKFDDQKYPEEIDHVLQKISNTKQTLALKRDQISVEMERTQKMQQLTKGLLTDIQNLEMEMNCITAPKISADDKRSALVTLQVKILIYQSILFYYI